MEIVNVCKKNRGFSSLIFHGQHTNKYIVLHIQHWSKDVKAKAEVSEAC